MKIPILAAYDGIRHIALVGGADASLYNTVDTYQFDMKASDMFSVAQVDAFLTSMPATKEPSGARSERAEQRLYPFAYVYIHVKGLEKNGEAVDKVTVEVLQEIGLSVLTAVWNRAEAPGPDFLAPPPPPLPDEKGGEKATQTSSKSSSGS